MARRRRNPEEEPSDDGWGRYASAHWGDEGTKHWVIDDDDLPDETIMMGALRELTIDPEDGEEPYDLILSKKCILSFDPGPSEKLYAILDPKIQEDCYFDFWEDAPDAPTYWLQAVAKQAGGRQAKYPAARVRVKVLGKCLSVVYTTLKVGDGMSDYEHTFAEGGGQHPYICIDEEGRLHFAGGQYTTPDAGITG